MADTPTNPIVNLDDLELMELSHGQAFAAKLGPMGHLIGAKQLGCMLTIVPPGKKAFPCHAHHTNEEMAFIMEGSGEARIGAERHPLRAGDVVVFLAGDGDTAHQIINTGAVELKYLCFSTKLDPDVVEYPDSGKFLVSSLIPPGAPNHDARVRYIGRANTSIDYWDGEEG